MLRRSSCLLLILTLSSFYLFGQISNESSDMEKEFTELEEALKNPENVVRLNLSNQNIRIPNETWLKFTNLEYLSLKNDRLIEIPQEIGLLTNLKVLDLSGNDFVSLPESFKNLTSLQEIFLNDEVKFDLNKSIRVLKSIPSLRTMHLENDNLTKLPKDFFEIKQLESLYLNNNRFIEIPRRIKRLENLKFVDFHDNDLHVESLHLLNQNFGFKIVF